MLESWTIQKLVEVTMEYLNGLQPTITVLLSMRIEGSELKKTPLFDVKQWIDYCPCGCDRYTPRININHDLAVEYHWKQIQKERQKLGID